MTAVLTPPAAAVIAVCLYAFLLFLAAAFMVLSLVRCRQPSAFKIVARATGILTGAAGIALLYFLNTRWDSITGRGFESLTALLFIYCALAVLQAAFSVISFKRGIFEIQGRVIYGIASALVLALAAALIILECL